MVARRAYEIEKKYWLMAQEPSQDTAKALRDEINRKSERQESKRVAETYMVRLTSLARALCYEPGQKHFIFFSNGIPGSLVYGHQVTSPQGFRDAPPKIEMPDFALKTLNEEMHKEFATSDCVIYAFDTRESAMMTDLFAYDEMTFENISPFTSRGMFMNSGVMMDSTSVFQDEKTAGADLLKGLADLTGGKYFSNINLYEKNLNQVQSLTGSYYVLGYYIGERGWPIS